MNLAEAFAVNDKISFGMEPTPDENLVKLLIKKTKKDLLAVVISNRDKDRVLLNLNDTLYVFSGPADSQNVSKALLVQNNSFPLIILKLLEEQRPLPEAAPEEEAFELTPGAIPLPTLPDEEIASDSVEPEKVDDDEITTLEELEEDGVVVAPLRQGEVLLDGVPELKDEEIDIVIDEPELAMETIPDSDEPAITMDETEAVAKSAPEESDEPEIIIGDVALADSDEPEIIIEDALPEEIDEPEITLPAHDDVPELALETDEPDDEEAPQLIADIPVADDDLALPGLDTEVLPSIPRAPAEESPLNATPTVPTFESDDHDGMLIEEIDDDVAPLDLSAAQPVPQSEPEEESVAPLVEEELVVDVVETPQPVSIPTPEPITAAEKNFDFFAVTLSTTAPEETPVFSFVDEKSASQTDPALSELLNRMDRLEKRVAESLGEGIEAPAESPVEALCLSLTTHGIKVASENLLPTATTIVVSVNRFWHPALRFTTEGEVASSQVVNGVAVSQITFGELSAEAEEAITAYMTDGSRYYDLLKNVDSPPRADG